MPTVAATLDEPELLRYRSNLLGSDLRITNFAGGNTSSKIMQIDPLTGEPVEVLWVKGSGGDLGSIKRTGFATLYQDKLLALERSYKGVDTEDDMVAMYPLCTFRNNPVAASIDTPLHGFLPFPHVDHLHPDWGIALAASANGKSKMEEFNREFNHSLVWIPWQRPGFELGMMMRKAIAENPGCDGIVLGGHGLFTWGETQRECYLNTLTIIDQIGQFIVATGSAKGPVRFGGEAVPARADRKELAIRIAPLSARPRECAKALDRELLRCSRCAAIRQLRERRKSWPSSAPVAPITSSAPRFGRLFVPWAADADLDALKAQIETSLDEYREQYRDYYHSFATPDSPALRDRQPHRRADSRHGHVQLRQEQDRGAHHRRVLHQRHSRDGGRNAAFRRRSRRHPPAVRRRHGSGELQGLHQLRGAACAWKHSASNTGRWKKPRSAASRRRKNSAAASCWSSAAAAASAAKWLSRPPNAARTLWSPIATKTPLRASPTNSTP